MEHVEDAIVVVAGVLEVVGVLVIVAGFAFTAARAARPSVEDRFRKLRHELGRSILVGLEVLVAADIIRTVAIEPDLRSVAILAGIVLIRTFLSTMLEVEISGRWPWHQAAQPDAPSR